MKKKVFYLVFVLLSQMVTAQTAPQTANYKEALRYYQQKDFGKAKNLLANPEKDDLTNADFFYLAGITYKKLNDADNAISSLKKAIELKPTHSDAAMQLGLLFYGQELYDDAADNFTIAYQQTANKSETGYYLGCSLLEGGNADLAIIYLEQAKKTDPSNSDIKTALERAYSKSKSIKKTISKVDPNGKISKEGVEWVNKGVAFYKNEEYKEAEKCFDKAVEIAPENAKVHYYHAVSLRESGYVSKAKKEFEKVLKLNPKYSQAYAALGSIHYDEEDFENAGGYFLQAVETGEETALNYYNLANCYYQLKDYNSSVNTYKKAIALNGNDQSTWFNYGLALHFNKDFNASIEAFNSLLALDGYTEMKPYYYIALNYIELGDLDKAIEVSLLAIDKDKEFAAGYYSAAIAYEKKQEIAKSESFRRIAYKLDPNLKQ